MQEARLISRLKDPSTVTMLDYGETEDGLLYMALEYVDGLTLRQMAEEFPLATDRTVKILRQILGSLQEAHVFGVLHRDIKPANIIVYDHAGRLDQVKLLDFGIAKVLEPKGTRPMTVVEMTGEDVLVGTPRYMSPEQIRGDKLTPASDIYSLGLVAYELVVGARAIDVESSVNIIGRHLDLAPIVLPDETPIPDQLRYVIDTMLDKDRNRRYASCDEVIADLETWDVAPASTVPGLKAIGAQGEEEVARKLSPPTLAKTTQYRVEDGKLQQAPEVDDEVSTVVDKSREMVHEPRLPHKEEDSPSYAVWFGAIATVAVLVFVTVWLFDSSDAPRETVALSAEEPVAISDTREIEAESAEIARSHTENAVDRVTRSVTQNARDVASSSREAIERERADRPTPRTKRPSKKKPKTKQKKRSSYEKPSSTVKKSSTAETKSSASKDESENELGIFGIE